MISARDHPLVKPHIDRSERLAQVATSVADELIQFALARYRKCPWPEGYLCACSGSCTDNPEYKAIEAMAFRLRAAAELDVQLDALGFPVNPTPETQNG